jgi:protein involved in polysaccharide export with SLBB domain
MPATNGTSRYFAGIGPSTSRLTRRLLVPLVWLAIATVGCTRDVKPTGPPPSPELERQPSLYRLEPGDEIEIRVLDLEELNEKLIVRPDGKISVPLLDDVPAAGHTAEELSEAISRGLSTQYARPAVTVIIRNFANLNVYVGGEVDRPGIVRLEHRMTVATAVFRAGGYLNTARTSNIIVVRDAGGKPLLQAVDLEAVLEGEQPDLPLRAHDIVFVPKSKVAELNLFFEQYVRRVIPADLSGAITYNFVSGAGR